MYFMVSYLRFYVSFVLSSIVITALWKKKTGRCAGCLLVCLPFVVSHFTTLPLGLERGLRYLIVALPRFIFIVFF